MMYGLHGVFLLLLGGGLHLFQEGFHVLLLHALRHYPGTFLVRRRRPDDADRHEIEVSEGYHVERLPPPVIHVEEAQPRPVRHEQRVVREGELVGILLEVPHSPLGELAGETGLGDPDDVHHVDELRGSDLAAAGGDGHRVEAVSVEPAFRGQQLLHQVAGVGEEAEVDVGLGVELDRAGARPPQLRDRDVEGGAAVAGELEVLRLDLVDGVVGDVHGVVEQPEGREDRWARGRELGRAGDDLPQPYRVHDGLRKAPSNLTDGVHELGGTEAVSDGVDGDEADDESAANELRHL
ncbi:hypothetical protein MUK42_19168 [Musa troglodytarum]|uniref:Uncharacterized protein n=1 Tax=Musa troglodytarum TaxID=320322 RepID=A0A9E7F9W1_9LILI|nr:hypothetical protein MUK42_19168 [Musa troglodytarum]